MKPKLILTKLVSAFDRLFSPIPRYKALKACNQKRSDYQNLWQHFEAKHGLLKTDYEFLRSAMTRRANSLRFRIFVTHASGILALLFAMSSSALIIGSFRTSLDLHGPTLISLAITSALVFVYKKHQTMPSFETGAHNFSEEQLMKIGLLKEAIIDCASQDKAFFTQSKEGQFYEMPSIFKNDEVIFNFVLGNIFSLNIQLIQEGTPTGPIFVRRTVKTKGLEDQSALVDIPNHKPSIPDTLNENVQNGTNVIVPDFTKPTVTQVKRTDPVMREIIFDHTSFEQFSSTIRSLRALKLKGPLPAGVKLQAAQERWIQGVNVLHQNKEIVERYSNSRDIGARKELEGMLFDILKTPKNTAEDIVSEFLKLTYRDFMAWIQRVQKFVETQGICEDE